MGTVETAQLISSLPIMEIIQNSDLDYSYYNQLQIIPLEIRNCTPLFLL